LDHVCSLKLNSILYLFQKKHRDLYLTGKEKKENTENEQPALSAYVKTDKTKYSSRDPRQLQITEALVMFITGDLMPDKDQTLHGGIHNLP